MDSQSLDTPIQPSPIGTRFLSLLFSRTKPSKLIDNLFNITSAISTTGLTTVSAKSNPAHRSAIIGG